MIYENTNRLTAQWYYSCFTSLVSNEMVAGCIAIGFLLCQGWDGGWWHERSRRILIHSFSVRVLPTDWLLLCCLLAQHCSSQFIIVNVHRGIVRCSTCTFILCRQLIDNLSTTVIRVARRTFPLSGRHHCIWNGTMITYKVPFQTLLNLPIYNIFNVKLPSNIKLKEMT
jgi:hypothetical protein